MDNLLKEAIADAKAVRETALENAKLALQEAFTPKLQSMLSKKIQMEMDDEDAVEEAEHEDEVEEGYHEDEEMEEAEHGDEEPKDEMAHADDEVEEQEEEDDVVEINGVKYAPVVSEEEEEEVEEEMDDEKMEEEEDEEDLDLEAVIKELEAEINEELEWIMLESDISSDAVTAIMEAFPGSFPAVRGAEWVGNPLRRGFLAGEAQSHENQPVTSVLRILVLGGSQGAQALNETVPDALSQLSEGTETEVVHQCGPAHLEATSDAYRRAGVRAQVEGFINDMPMVYEWAQLVVCRAGAMTVAELAGRGVASILVPFPHAVDDHQSANAQFLVAAGAALVIPQTQLDGPRLARTIDALHQENGRLSEMGRRARGLAREDAAGRVAAQCLESAHV